MAKIGSLLITTFLMVCVVQAHAEVKVQAVVDQNQVNVGDPLTFVISVISSDEVQISDPQLPSLNNFEVLQTWRSSEAQSSFTAQGFISQQTEKFNFTLVPRSEGQLTIGSATVEVDGRAMRTAPIRIQVFGPKSGRSAPSRPQARGQNQRPAPGSGFDPFGGNDMDDAFNAMLQDMMGRRGQGNDPRNGQNPQGQFEVEGPTIKDMVYDAKGDPDFFIAVHAQKKSAYVNEPIMVSYYLYARGQVVDLDTLQYPNLKGFWKEDIEVATALNFVPEFVNGQRYNRALLVSYALFPIKAGSMTIDSYKAKVSLVVNPFGFGGKTTQTRNSPPVVVDVKPLPVPQPESFVGAVGQFGVSFQPETSQPVQGQPFVVRLRIEGVGNAKLIQNPKVNWPEGIEVYDTKSSAQYFKDGRSFKEMEYFLVSSKEGVIDFSPLSFSYFDFKKAQYTSAAVNGFKLQFAKETTDPKLAQSKMKAKSQELAAPKDLTPNPQIDSHASVFSISQNVQWVVMLLSLIGGLALTLKKFALELGWGAQKKTIEAQVRRRLKRVEEMVSKNDVRGTSTQLLNLLNFVLGAVTSDSGSSRETRALIDELPPSVRRELSSQILKMSETYQTLSFAPQEMIQTVNNQSLHDVVAESKALVQKILELSFGHKEE